MLIFVLFAISITSSCGAHHSECSEKNASCEDLKMPDGYRYFYPESGCETEVYLNKTLIAHGGGNHNFTITPGVIRMDSNSIITMRCQNLSLKSFVTKGNTIIEEPCLDYVVTEKKPEVGSPTSLWVIIPVFAIIIIIIIISSTFVGICICKRDPRQSQQMQQQNPATLALFTSCFRSSSCRRERISQAERREEGESPEEIRVISQSNGGPVDLNIDAISLVHLNPASSHQAMNRNLRDDPGGLDGHNGEDSEYTLHLQTKEGGSQAERREEGECPGEIRNMDMAGDRTPGDQGLGEHQTEEQPLLSTNGHTVQDSNSTDETSALVNKHGLDPHQANGHFIAPDKGSSDVESAGTKHYNKL